MTTESMPVKKKKKSGWWLTILILLVIAGAVFLFNIYRQQQTREAAIAELRTTPFTRETLQTTISGTGNVRPRQSIVLTWQTSGTVASVEVEEGDLVEKDQILLSLDENDLPAEIIQASLNKITATQALDQLDANILLQRATLNNNIESVQSAINDLETQLLNLESRECETWRTDNLRSDYDTALEAYQNWPSETGWLRVQAAKTALDFCDPQVISQQINSVQSQLDLQKENESMWRQDLEKIQFGPDPVEVEKLELQLSLAEKQLATQFIKAPFDGTLLSLVQVSGDQVRPGTVAGEVADISEMFVEVPISEVDIPAIQIGQSVSLFFDAYFEEEFSGVVSDISSTADRSTGVVNYTVTIKLEDQSDRIKPGMTAAVSILTDEKPGALVIPADSIFSRDGLDYVYVLRNGNPEMVQVTVGAYSNQLIEVLGTTIAEGELIVVNPPIDLLSSFRMGPGSRFR
ncbi:MAG: efflux RND transporter periplasmic adaptor subunit [Anaerolineaceae bacterium]|nr:efflux RND transporter periplasmic adaptor subunit [Anaerolineaceae bacterium]MDD4043047.1 efflux RND transporter periplasmic adaptor subunit [Anaerolineaceae bacterium]MDD4577275.1 efflux RND transporter periplasmic adaptor subunit [Anaerolineaceae bacterium]